MSNLHYTLPVIWALIIGTAVALYVVLDGFDLGLGILFPFFKDEAERDVMMNSVAPFWDGNEAWLVLGGASLLCGVALVVGYARLGATWLIMKTEGPAEQRAHRIATPLLLWLLSIILLVSVWTPIQIPRIADRWFSLPNLLFLMPVPLATLVLAWLCWNGIIRRRPLQPFACAVGLFLLAYAGLAISNLPYLVPPSLTVWQAAADPASQVFMLIGTVILLPLILGYTVLVFWLFRGKVRPGEGYHLFCVWLLCCYGMIACLTRDMPERCFGLLDVRHAF